MTRLGMLLACMALAAVLLPAASSHDLAALSRKLESLESEVKEQRQVRGGGAGTRRCAA